MRFELTAQDYYEAANAEARKAILRGREGVRSEKVAAFHRARATEYRAKGRELASQDQRQP